jgi:hypothetical protein
MDRVQNRDAPVYRHAQKQYFLLSRREITIGWQRLDSERRGRSGNDTVRNDYRPARREPTAGRLDTLPLLVKPPVFRLAIFPISENNCPGYKLPRSSSLCQVGSPPFPLHYSLENAIVPRHHVLWLCVGARLQPTLHVPVGPGVQFECSIIRNRHVFTHSFG